VTQYDLCRNKGRGAKRAPFLLILQRDAVSALPTRLVAPVMRLAQNEVLTKLMIPINVEGELLHIALPELFAINYSSLGSVAGNLGALHTDIVRALDMLITG
jgi:CcdB protein